MGPNGQKLLAAIKQIPLVGSAFSFPWIVWKRASLELVFLWGVSSLPLIISIIAKMVPGGSFQNAAEEEVNIKAIFVYTSAFLAPLFYLFVDRLRQTQSDQKMKIFSGVHWVMLVGLIILGLSSWLFQNDKLKDLHAWQSVSIPMYFISIYLWWLAIADNHNCSLYVTETTQDENDFAEKAARRRKEKKNEEGN